MDAERELITRCLNRDPEAEHQFYQWFSNKMFGICKRYGADTLEAEDLLHEGFIRVFYGLPYFRFEGSLEAWVRRTIINSITNQKKKYLKFQAEVELDCVNDEELLCCNILDDLSKDDLCAILNVMPAGYRTVFNLVVIDGYSHSETSSMLGISENASRANLSRAKAWIRNRPILMNKLGLNI